MQKTFVRGTWQQTRAFSPAVIVSGEAKTIYVAGHTGQTADDGRSLAGDFDAQCRQTFRNIEKTLAEAGAKHRPGHDDRVSRRFPLHHAHDGTARRYLRQGFSRQRRYQLQWLCAAVDHD